MISIIVAHRNEPASLTNILLPSLKVLADQGWIFELVIVDDASDRELRPDAGIINEKYRDLKILIINSYKSSIARQGVSRSRITGAQHARFHDLCFVDAHSRFSPDFFHSILPWVCDVKDTFICGQYQHVTADETLDGCGASLRFYVQDVESKLVDIIRVDRNAHKLDEKIPMPEVQAPIGANYLVRRDRFLDIAKSLKGLVNWCQFEAFVALYCAKMKIPILCDRSVIIEHVNVLSGAKGESRIEELFFNKLFCLWMFMPEAIFGVWKMRLKSAVDAETYRLAFQRLETVKGLYQSERDRLQFTDQELDAYCERWNIPHPISL